MTRRRTDRTHHPRRSRIVPGSGRETNLRRRSDQYEQVPAILIATNGESTEKDYLDALKREPWVRAGRISVVVERGSPLDVVRGVAGRRDRDDYDEAWAVCDVDAYDTRSATVAADQTKVNITWSNPCFEVWLILHRAPWTAYLDSADHATARLRATLGTWNKTRLDFSDFRDGVDTAVARAKALDPPPEANPSTAVWQLVEALRRTEPRDSP
jgi:hypothetical protein